MARMIDGDKLVENLRLIATCWSISPYVSKEKHNGAVDMLREVEREVKEAPTLTPPNEPLTIEQLREMNETPIYVVTETYGSGWCILNWHGVNKSYTYFSRTGTPEGMTATPLSAKTYGDLWTAYRRPPEGEE